MNKRKIQDFNAFFPDWRNWRKLEPKTDLIEELKKARAEMCYWWSKAEQLAVNNKKCLNCVAGKMEVYETMTCRKCERLLRDWHKAGNNAFYLNEALKRQEKIKENYEKQ